ncbi:NUDIX domain-containing protein [Falsibacillus pallidus]|uniref:NUDIX domain-containing protein n=1 Tax=Falsibacillus pallidus TaxID=493781 RepID=UPI003D96576F
MTYPIRVRAGVVIIENDHILLAEFNDEKSGLHYNFPSGGVEAGESVKEAAKREAWEEGGVEVEIGEFAFSYEYSPHLLDHRFGPVQSLSMIFKATLSRHYNSFKPAAPDPKQTGAKWIPIEKLKEIKLYPVVQEELLNYLQNGVKGQYIEEHTLFSNV